MTSPQSNTGPGTTSISPKPCRTFHGFNNLPDEIKFKIWEYHIDRTPRIFELAPAIVCDDVKPKRIKLKLVGPSFPILIPFPANINQQLRHEMAKRYRRIEFAYYVAWIDLHIDTIFASYLCDNRFLLNFNQLASHHHWLKDIEHFAVSYDKFFGLQVFSYFSNITNILRRRQFSMVQPDATYCWSQCTGGFTHYMEHNFRKRDKLKSWYSDIPGQTFQDRTESWPALLAFMPKVKKLRIIHHSKDYRFYDTGIIEGALDFDLHYFDVENTNVHGEPYFEERKSMASLFLTRWKKSNPMLGKLELEHVGLMRNGIKEDEMCKLTLPYRLQCRNPIHIIKRLGKATCPCAWGRPDLPPGIIEYQPDKLGPFLTSADGKRIRFHFSRDKGQLKRWKLGQKFTKPPCKCQIFF